MGVAPQGRGHQAAALAFGAAMTAVAWVDVATPNVSLVPFLAVFVLAAATFLPVRLVAVLGAVSVACAATEGDLEGTLRSVDFVVRVLVLVASALFGIIACHQRVTREMRLREQSTTDPLTGLPNRSVTLQVLRRELARRAQAPPITVIFVDVDEFKAINDRHGHTAGDHVLRQVGARLSATVRAEDVVTRYAGDEFVIVCTSVADATAARSLCDRLTAAVAAPLQPPDGPYGITASIGAVHIADRNWSAEELLAKSDAAMFVAKFAGGSRHHLTVLPEGSPRASPPTLIHLPKT